MKEYNLSEDDLVTLFAKNYRKRKDLFLVVAGVVNKVFLGICLFILSYIIINFPAIRDKTTFWYKTNIETSEPIAQTVPEPTSESLANTSNSDNDIAIAPVPDITNNSINIPVLNIKAPISWRVANTASDVSSGLEKGIIQVDGTSLPGEKGNVYVTGHSSNYVWAKGSYNSIFAIVDQLVAGDIIYIKYNDTVYTYEVLNQKIVAANDLTILGQTDDSRLTLVTCWPVGTSYKRLVVTANQVSPDPKLNALPVSKPAFTTLPSGR